MDVKKYLENICQTHNISGIMVTGKDGLMLSSYGTVLEDAGIGLLPDWLDAGDAIAQCDSNLDALSFCCLMPKHKKSMVIGWRVHRDTRPLYLAISVKRIPPNIAGLLEEITKEFLNQTSEEA